MLVIRMQRTGRKGHAMFRVVVQDARLTPTSGKVVALVGSYDPHAKSAQLDKDKASFYLKNGARPSPRVARLFKEEKIKLPDWVVVETGDKKRAIRNPEKLRKNQPAVPAEPEVEASAPVEEPAVAPTIEAENAPNEPEDQPKAE